MDILSTKLVSELHRRGLFKVGGAYLVSAWAIVKMANVGVEKFAGPEWIMQGLLAVLYAGFPLARGWTWRYGLELPSLNFDAGDGEFESPELGVSGLMAHEGPATYPCFTIAIGCIHIWAT